MRRLIEGAIRNSPAMNTLMIGVLSVGLVCFALMRREIFPEFELDIVLVSVPYPGASPDEIERGICQKVEEAVQSIDGIKRMTSVAQENVGSVILTLKSNVKDVQRVVNDVRSEVDRIPSFPDLAEDVEVSEIVFRQPAMKISILAPEDGEYDPLTLRAVAEQVRTDILGLPNVSQATIKNALDYQIDVELEEDVLRKHGLSLNQVANIIRRENLEVPAGTIRSVGQDVLLRSKNKSDNGIDIAKLPLVTDPSGVVLTVGDLGTVRDELTDATAISETNGRPALMMQIERTSKEDLLTIVEEIREYAEGRQLPGGYEMLLWDDASVEVRDRLDMLVENGITGLILVFLVLAVFLEIRLAFWVAMGIPIAILGAGGLLYAGGQTLNMLSTFSFLMALGIIVDDAIVVGENVYSHRQMGKSFMQSAIDGTLEVLPSVSASVTTTIIAFCPLLFVVGIMGKFIGVMPFAVIAMLIVSLFECLLILPCHLAHGDSAFFRVIGFLFYPLRFLVDVFGRINAMTARGLNRFVDTIYTPVLKWSIENRWTSLSLAAAILLIAIGFVAGGFVQFIVFDSDDASIMIANVRFPDGTPERITDDATKQVMAALKRADEKNGGVVKVIHRTVGLLEGGGPDAETTSGGHVGSIRVQLVGEEKRTATSKELVNQWRGEVPEIAGIENLAFGSDQRGPGGTPIEFRLLAEPGSEHLLEPAIEKCKAKLAEFDGIFDIQDDSRPGKWEFQVKIKDRAKSMGVSSRDLADTIRASYYGTEVMRLQRGRHEVKLMVRYPRESRRSYADFGEIRVRTGDGSERPIKELADVTIVRGYSEINRLDQKRCVKVTADLDPKIANARETVVNLQAGFMPELLQDNPGLSINWEGQQEQTMESFYSLVKGTGIALIVMFALLTLEFKSYLQPLLILLIIPFGIVGAIFGHFVMGIPMMLFSLFGIVALTGVVVNDSIVLIDFINARVEAGVPYKEAVVEAGRRRFRPVLLTSATTIAGLIPILLEGSLQAQILIPMATSLAFGLLLATILVLVLVPTLYRIYRDFIPYEGEEKEEFLSEEELEAALSYN